MEECFGGFRVEEDYTWRDDIMTVTRRIIDEIDDARLSNIAAHFDVDLSEIREFLDAKRRKHFAPMTNGDRIRSMSDEELADFITDDMCRLICGDPLECEGQCKQKMFDWLKKETIE